MTRFQRSKRADQTSKVSKATSARPPPSIDQSPTSKPKSRRSVLVYAVMSSSHWSNHKVADKWRLGCCRGATSDEKGISFKLRLRGILAVFQSLKGLTRYSRRPSTEDIPKCCICASVRPIVSKYTMPALLRQMDFLRWLRRKETHRIAELTRTVRAEIAVNPVVRLTVHSRAFSIEQKRGQRGALDQRIWRNFASILRRIGAVSLRGLLRIPCRA